MGKRNNGKVEVRASRRIKDCGGWERYLNHYNNGVVAYEVIKDGHNFWFRTKSECDWFCRIFYGSMSEGLMNALEERFGRFSFEVVVEGLQCGFLSLSRS